MATPSAKFTNVKSINARLKKLALAQASETSLHVSAFSVLVSWTPQMASDVLASCNTYNRPYNDKAVRRLVADILSGNFALTHQPIAFDVSGSLLDGQTRLRAISDSGKIVSLFTTFDLPVLARVAKSGGSLVRTKLSVPTQMVIDIGMPRTFSQHLTIEQRRDGRTVTDADNKSAQSIVRKIALMTWHQNGLPTTQLKALYLDLANDIDAVLAVQNRSRRNGIAIAKDVLACFVFARIAHPRKIDRFLPGFFGGVGLDSGSPALMLQRQILELRNKQLWTDEVTRTIRMRYTLLCLLSVIGQAQPALVGGQKPSISSLLRKINPDTINRIGEILGLLPKDLAD